MNIGTKLYGYCGGYFGRDSYDDKRIEGLGVDWVAAREESGLVVMANVAPEMLAEFTVPEDET